MGIVSLVGRAIGERAHAAVDLPVGGKVHDGRVADAGDDEEAGWLRIGQLAEATGESAKTLRFYDDAGVLVASARSAAGYRLYAPAVIDRVALIRAGQAAGLRLDEIAVLLDSAPDGEAPTTVNAGEVLERIEATQENLARLHRWVTDRTGRDDRS